MHGAAAATSSPAGVIRPGDPDDRRTYVTPAKLAIDLSRIFDVTISSNTLAKWRCARKGPAFVKVGRRVRYAVRDVERWVNGQTRNAQLEAPE